MCASSISFQLGYFLQPESGMSYCLHNYNCSFAPDIMVIAFVRFVSFDSTEKKICSAAVETTIKSKT